VNEHNELLSAEIEFLELISVENLLDRLQLGEVISFTDSSERFVEWRRVEIEFGENVRYIAFPRMFQFEADFGPPVEFGVALNEIGLEQCHAATDVTADQVRVNVSLCYERRARWADFARM